MANEQKVLWLKGSAVLIPFQIQEVWPNQPLQRTLPCFALQRR